MEAGAEKNISQCSYTWEKKYYTLDKEQNNILKILKEHGYTGFNQRSKVRYITEGIKNTSLNSVKTPIMSNEILFQDFDGCVTLYKAFLKQSNVNDRQ